MKGQLIVLAIWLGVVMTMDTQETKDNGHRYPQPVDMKDILPSSVQIPSKDPEIHSSMVQLNRLEVPKFNYLLPSPGNPMFARMYPKEKKLMAEMESDLHLRRLHMQSMQGEEPSDQFYTNVYRNALAKAMAAADIESSKSVDEPTGQEKPVSPPEEAGGKTHENKKIPLQEVEPIPTVIHHPYLQNYEYRQMQIHEQEAHPQQRFGITGRYSHPEHYRETRKGVPPELQSHQVFHGVDTQREYHENQNSMQEVPQNLKDNSDYLVPENADQQGTHEQVGTAQTGFQHPAFVLSMPGALPGHPNPTTQSGGSHVRQQGPSVYQNGESHPMPSQGAYDEPASESQTSFIHNVYPRSEQTTYLKPESKTYQRSERGLDSDEQQYGIEEEEGEQNEEHEGLENGQVNLTPQAEEIQQENHENFLQQSYGNSAVSPMPQSEGQQHSDSVYMPPAPVFFFYPGDHANGLNYLRMPISTPYHTPIELDRGNHDEQERSEEEDPKDSGDLFENEQYHGVYYGKEDFHEQPVENQILPYEESEVKDNSGEEEENTNEEENNYVPPTASDSSTEYPRPTPSHFFPAQRSEHEEKSPGSEEEMYEEHMEEDPTVAPTLSSYEAKLRESFSDYQQATNAAREEIGRQRRHHLSGREREDGKSSGKRKPTGQPIVTYMPLRIGGYYGNRPYVRPSGYLHFPNPYLAFSPYEQYRNHPFYSSKEYIDMVQGSRLPLDGRKNATRDWKDIVHGVPSGKPEVIKYDPKAQATVVYRPHPYVHSFATQVPRNPDPTPKDNPFRAIYYQYRNHPFYRLQTRRNRESEHKGDIHLKPAVLKTNKRPVQGKEGVKEPVRKFIPKPIPEKIHNPPPVRQQAVFRPVPFLTYNKIPDYDPSIHDLPTSPSLPAYTPINGTQRFCYNCAWTSDKPDTNPHLARVGGWKRCIYAFHHDEAEPFSIKQELCHDNCFIKVDKNNSVFRGCYRGEVDIDPTKTGCHKQGEDGTVYCFCDGSSCNNSNAPEYFK